jgi:Kef-type K+ transport system membrane component KefB
MVVAAAVFVLVARLARVPSIVAYIVAGLILGPATGILHVTDATDLIAEVGIVLLLFLVGLELSLDKLRDVGRVAAVAGLAQVVLATGAGYLLCMVFGFGRVESLFLSVALTFSSTVVVVKLLAEKGEFDTLYGRIALGILLVQDMVVILLLTFVAGLGSGEDTTLGSLMMGFGSAFGGMAILLLSALMAARYLLPRLFGWISSSLEALFIWSLSWCFLMVGAAELLHLSVEIGAFIAGLSLAQLPYNLELRRRVHPLTNFFIAIFFITLGLEMQLEAASRLWLPALAFVLFVLVIQPMIFLWLVARVGFGERTSFLTGVTLGQISEFSFIFGALGVSTGLITETTLSMIALVGLVSIAASAYMIQYNGQIYERLRGGWVLRIFGAPDEEVTRPASRPHSDHVLVVGLNSLGMHLVDELLKRGETIIAIDTDPAKLRRMQCETILGSVDHPSVLEEANLHEAKLVVSALQIEETNNLLAYRCREAGVPCSIHAFDRSVIAELRAVGVNHLMIPKHNGIKRIIEELKRRGLVET